MRNVVTIKAQLSSTNQLTVPKAVREYLDLSDYDKVVFQLDHGTVTLRKDPDFWNIVKQQERIYGNLSMNELDWGADAGNEDIPE